MGARFDQPLVIATHHSRPPLHLDVARARRLAARLPHDLARVRRDPAARAVVPASRVGPGVQVATVGGVDPLRHPDRYPLRVPARGPQPPVVTLTVVGDIMLGRGVAASARGTGDPAAALAPTAGRLAAADLTVGNLESTLSRAGTARQGDDSFAASPRVLPGLRRAGFDVLGLANNHLGDFGPAALTRTVQRLQAAGFATFGAGAGPRAAWRPAVLARSGVRFGFVGFNAIGETPEVAAGRPGVISISMPPRTGPLDRPELRRFLGAVRDLAGRVDVVVVLPHWGMQYTAAPEPVQHRVARRLVAAGADLVVGGHPHWVQGVELVDRVVVAHSLGNFVFDMDFMPQTMRGVVLEAAVWGDQVKAVRFVPYLMDDRFAPRVVTRRAGLDTLRLLWSSSGAAFRP